MQNIWDGSPANPEQAAWHWLFCSTGDAEGIEAWFWVPAEQNGGASEGSLGGWTKDSLRENAEILEGAAGMDDHGITVHRYLGPCVMPEAD